MNEVENYALTHTNDPLAREFLEAKKRGELHLIDIPYSKKEKLHKVHPGRMVKLLLKKECITKIPPPKIVTRIFNSDTFKPIKY